MFENTYAMFNTALGRCAMAWNNIGITCILLPGATPGETQKRLVELCPDATPAAAPSQVQAAMDDIGGLLRGQPCSLSHIALDMSRITPFFRRVYEVTRKVPPGSTVTYGDIAERLGSPRAARAVGQALGKNPFAIVVPCHRVLASNGRLCGFSAHGGVATKLRLLEIEGSRLPLNG